MGKKVTNQVQRHPSLPPAFANLICLKWVHPPCFSMTVELGSFL